VDIIETRVGEFLQEHAKNIIEMCKEDANEFSNLQDIEYTKTTFGSRTNYPLLNKLSNIEEQNHVERYYKKDYMINDEIYRICSQFGGSKTIAGKTASEYHGKKIYDYLKVKNILLNKFKDKNIIFIVGSKDNVGDKNEIVTPLNNLKMLHSFNQILYGPPGTGKTYSTINKVIEIIENRILLDDELKDRESLKAKFEQYQNHGQIEFITFHQSYGYEEFVEGIKAIPVGEVGNENGTEMIYKVTDGIFKKIADKARKNPDYKYILLIDEINRGNISKIFGELITLIEDSKRIGASEEIQVVLPYSSRKFGVPQNLYIIGTMNTADRSIALMDTALRRRFEFVEMMPDLKTLQGIAVEDINIYALLEIINKRVEYLYDRDHTIGHAYFMELKKDDSDINTLSNIFKNKIIPLLQEYFYDDWEKIRLVLGDNQKENENFQFVKIKSGYSMKELFGEKELDFLDIDDESIMYEINEKAFYFPESYIKIYEK